MGIDTKLLVNAKWDVKNIETLLVEGLGHKIERAEYKGDHAFLNIILSNGSKRMIYVAHTTDHGGLNGLLLSLHSNDEAIDLFKSIAKVLGGFLNKNDSSNDYEMFQEPHDGNARFVLDHVILSKAVSRSSELADKVKEAIDYK